MVRNRNFYGVKKKLRVDRAKGDTKWFNDHELSYLLHHHASPSIYHIDKYYLIKGLVRVRVLKLIFSQKRNTVREYFRVMNFNSINTY